MSDRYGLLQKREFEEIKELEEEQMAMSLVNLQRFQNSNQKIQKGQKRISEPQNEEFEEMQGDEDRSSKQNNSDPISSLLENKFLNIDHKGQKKTKNSQNSQHQSNKSDQLIGKDELTQEFDHKIQSIGISDSSASQNNELSTLIPKNGNYDMHSKFTSPFTPASLNTSYDNINPYDIFKQSQNSSASTSQLTAAQKKSMKNIQNMQNMQKNSNLSEDIIGEDEDDEQNLGIPLINKSKKPSMMTVKSKDLDSKLVSQFKKQREKFKIPEERLKKYEKVKFENKSSVFAITGAPKSLQIGKSNYKGVILSHVKSLNSIIVN